MSVASNILYNILELEPALIRLCIGKKNLFLFVGIFESCVHIIASSEVLTEFFDCNSYINSSDEDQCDDITRNLKYCYDDEFHCGDKSCIPLKWRYECILNFFFRLN